MLENILNRIKRKKKNSGNKDDRDASNIPLATRSMIVSFNPCDEDGKTDTVDIEPTTLVIPPFDVSISKRGQDVTVELQSNNITYDNIPNDRCHVHILATDSPEPKYATDPTSLGYFGMRIFLLNAELIFKEPVIFKGKYGNLEERFTLPLRPSGNDAEKNTFSRKRS